MNLLSAFFDYFLDFVFPKNCLQCGEKLRDDESYFCTECMAAVNYVNPDNLENIYHLRYGGNTNMDGIRSLFYFSPESVSQKIIHSIKYDGMKNLGKLMGKTLGERMFGPEDKFDMIIPVPLHKGKEKERGFNQSRIIAEGLSSVLNIPVESKTLIRKKYTESQTKLNKESRKENVHDAFKIHPGSPDKTKERNILLLDDVITSGSTTEACARVLKENGAKRVVGVSLGLVEKT